MTRAPGFYFSDGILLCADTEVTHALGKSQQSKLYTYRSKGGSLLAFAAAGNLHYAEMAMEKIKRRLKTESWRAEILDTVEKTNLDIYKQHVYIMPSPNDYSYDLLLALHIKGRTAAELFVCAATAVAPVSHRQCLGYGQALANYLADIIRQ